MPAEGKYNSVCIRMHVVGVCVLEGVHAMCLPSILVCRLNDTMVAAIADGNRGMLRIEGLEEISILPVKSGISGNVIGVDSETGFVRIAGIDIHAHNGNNLQPDAESMSVGEMVKGGMPIIVLQGQKTISSELERNGTGGMQRQMEVFILALTIRCRGIA